jgi:ribosome-binding protein aMBF1 (putative translation factor)
MSYNNYQDWEENTIGGGNISYNKNNTTIKTSTTKNQNLPGNKIKNQLENDEIQSLPKVLYEDAKNIEKKRNLIGLTQKQLAQNLNIPHNIITDIEKGSLNNNKSLLSKINRYLDNLIKKK